MLLLLGRVLLPHAAVGTGSNDGYWQSLPGPGPASSSQCHNVRLDPQRVSGSAMQEQEVRDCLLNTLDQSTLIAPLTCLKVS